MKPNLSKELIVIAGPTAVGKTELTIRLAEQLGTVILSADSRQVFRELSIGTAKPSAEELARVPHYFINSHSIQESFSAGDFEREALKLLAILFETHDKVLVTGGSGLYIKALCEGLDELPAPLSGIRERLMERLVEEGLAVLQQEVAQIDPAFAATDEWKNSQRVLRALEVYQSTGKPITSYQKKEISARPFSIKLIALERPREELYARIDQRMDLMLEAGLLEEVEAVKEFRSCQALQTVGYKEVLAYMDGEYDREEMIRLLKRNSRRYAKRQLTWFKHQGDFKWFFPDELEDILTYVSQ